MEKHYAITSQGREYRVREFTTTAAGLARLMAEDVLVIDATAADRLGMIRVTVAERA